MRAGSAPTGNFNHRPSGPPCTCDDVFSGFLWHELTTLNSSQLPREPGVYVLRVIERGGNVEEVIESFRKHIFQSRWSELIRFVESRLARIEGIGGSECPVLYIGSTGNLSRRFRRLTSGGHTIFFAVLPLLLNGWKLEYGYLRLETRKEAKCREESLLYDYCVKHRRNPLLNKKCSLPSHRLKKSNQ